MQARFRGRMFVEFWQPFAMDRGKFGTSGANPKLFGKGFGETEQNIEVFIPNEAEGARSPGRLKMGISMTGGQYGVAPLILLRSINHKLEIQSPTANGTSPKIQHRPAADIRPNIMSLDVPYVGQRV